MQMETFGTMPLSSIVKSYLYQQYFDDADLASFFSAYNSLAQGYLDWFNDTPLGVYTNLNINGPLLDWVGQGIYGINRPVLSTLTLQQAGAYNSMPYSEVAYNRQPVNQSGTTQVVNDDIYKRVLTWHAYLGDGRQMSIEWVRRRVARFLWGINGTDVPVDDTWLVRIAPPSAASPGGYNSAPYDTTAYNATSRAQYLGARALQISIPNTPVSAQFVALLEQGYLVLPFQVRFTVQTPGALLDSTFVLDQSTLS
jgi:hypothetical protein